jgi:hypothetical protein
VQEVPQRRREDVQDVTAVDEESAA